MQLSPTSYAVTGLGAIPPWVVNAGFVVGQEKTIIIDTGMNLLAGQTIYGYASAVRADNEMIVVNCEPHFDHIGGNGFFRSRGIDIYGHPDIQRTHPQFQGEKDEYNQSILNATRQKKQETDAFFLDTAVTNPNCPLKPGDSFDLGGVIVEILATPGHTPINCSVYNPTDQVLFCADCIVTHYIPNLEAGTANDWQAWLKSLDLIEALAPQIIVPGHGNVITGGAIAQEIERMRHIISEALEQGRAPTA